MMPLRSGNSVLYNPEAAPPAVLLSPKGDSCLSALGFLEKSDFACSTSIARRNGIREKRIRDLTLLAESCRRAHKANDASRALFAIGVLYEGAQEHKKAINAYSRYQVEREKCCDDEGRYMAANRLGVNYHLCADAQLRQGERFAAARLFEKARDFHKLHCQSAVITDKVVAHINIERGFTALGEDQHAATHLLLASRYLKSLRSMPGDSGSAHGKEASEESRQSSSNKEGTAATVQESSLACPDKIAEKEGLSLVTSNLSEKPNGDSGLNQTGTQKYSKVLSLVQQYTGTIQHIKVNSPRADVFRKLKNITWEIMKTGDPSFFHKKALYPVAGSHAGGGTPISNYATDGDTDTGPETLPDVTTRTAYLVDSTRLDDYFGNISCD